jgi:PAS domain S-box-containing protein
LGLVTLLETRNQAQYIFFNIYTVLDRMAAAKKEELPPEWLPIILQGSFSEIYVLDCRSLHFLEVNPVAQKNLQYSAQELAGMTPFDIAEDLAREVFAEILAPLQKGELAQTGLTTLHVRRDGSIYPVEFRLFHVASAIKPVIIAIGNDLSAQYESAQALCASQSRYHALSAHIEKAKEQERTRISREIHDDLGGNLTAIKIALAMLSKRLSPAESALMEKAQYIDALVDRTIESIHRIAGDLRPEILDFGLVAAIAWQAREFEKHLGIPCVVTCNQQEIALPADLATALFRIFQEALTNISKHAQARQVKVRLTRLSRNIRLEVSDDGKGLTPHDQSKPQSFGIRSMIERASAFGGEVTFQNPPSGGCVVMIRIPVAKA